MTWTEPGTFEVAPGVHRIPLPLPQDGLRAVNVYALTTDDGLLLVDGGWALPESRQVLDRGLAALGATVHDVRRFLVTHAHRDHYTQAAVLRAETGAHVSLGAGERPNVERILGPAPVGLVAQVEHLRRCGADKLADLIARAPREHLPTEREWQPPDTWLEPGDVVLPGGRVLEAVPTPGHTAGHLVFHDLAAGLLFAGDHVLPTITPSIGFQPVLVPDPLGDFLRSLALVRSRPDALLLPAHGLPGGSVHARVDELVDHHGRRLDESYAAVEGTGSAALEVAGVLRWTRRGRALDELDPFNQMLAVSETAAHLDLLCAQGRLVAEDVEGVRRYR